MIDSENSLNEDEISKHEEEKEDIKVSLTQYDNHT